MRSLFVRSESASGLKEEMVLLAESGMSHFPWCTIHYNNTFEIRFGHFAYTSRYWSASKTGFKILANTVYLMENGLLSISGCVNACRLVEN